MHHHITNKMHHLQHQQPNTDSNSTANTPPNTTSSASPSPSLSHLSNTSSTGSSSSSASASAVTRGAVLSPDACAAYLAEFHSPHTDNQQKRALDTQLTNHQSHPHSWPSALGSLALPPDTDPYAWHFHATTVQLAITRRWTATASAAGGAGAGQLAPSQRQQLRDGVWQCFMSQLGTHPQRLKRDKLAQLIALMGKQDFPHEHPTYMAHVLQLLRQNFELGLALLRATSDELCSTRDDCTAQRRREFHEALALCVPEAMDVLCGYLAGFVERCDAVQRELETGQKEATAAGAGNQMEQERLGCGSIPREGEQMQAAAVECLGCVQNLFAWIAPDQHLSGQLLGAVFQLARYRSQSSEVGAAALQAIAELFYRQVAVPQYAEIARNLRALLVHQDAAVLRGAHELYQDKLTELLRVFSAQHWHELLQPSHQSDEAGGIGGKDDGGAPALLNALYDFTFAAYGPLAFTERLAIWCPLVRGMAAQGESTTECTQLLVSGILRKFQFRFDQDAELDTLDAEAEAEGEESEWQQYLRQCIDTIVLIAGARAVPVFEQVFADWQRPFEMLMSLQKQGGGAVDGVRAEVAATVADYQRCNLLRCVVRDLASLAQTLCCLIPVLHNHPTGELPVNVHLLADQLIAAVAFLAPSRLYNMRSGNAVIPQIRLDFIELYTQVLMALRNFLSWSPALRTEAVLKPLIENVANTLLASQPELGGGGGGGADCSANSSGQEQQEPRLIVLAASQLLLSITSILRPKYALECPSMQALYQAGPHLGHLDSLAAQTVHQSLIAWLIVPWQLGCTSSGSASASVSVTSPSTASSATSSADQDMDRRAALLAEYIAMLARDLLALDPTPAAAQQDKILKITAATLPPLAAVLAHFAEHPTAGKLMLAAAYRPVLGKSIALFGAFGAHSAEVAECVLRLALTAVRTLQQQLGAAYLKEMLGIFLEAATRGEMTVARLRTMDLLLQMLRLVVEQPGAVGLGLMPAVLTVALDLVQPVLQQQQQTRLGGQPEVDLGDVTQSLFGLFDGILHHRWQYFYKSQVLRGFSPADNPHSNQSASAASASSAASPQHADQLHAMLTAYGQALCTCSHDPHLIALLLRSLQSLHERQQLFSRPLFRDGLLQSFHCALISALIASPLHADAMLTVLFTMGQVSAQQLHGSFVQLGYAADSGAVEQICLAADLPTFSQRMAALIQDTRCTQLGREATAEVAQ